MFVFLTLFSIATDDNIQELIETYTLNKNVAQSDIDEHKHQLYYELSQQRRATQIQGLKDFKTLWHAEGNVPKSIQQIAKYWSSWLKTKDGTIAIPREKQTENLSSYHEILALLAIDLEIVFGVNTAHREIISAWLGAMQIYTKTKFHCHMLLSGDAQTSKTYTLEMLYKMCIPGSASMLAMSTGKAKTAMSNTFASMIEIYQEVPPSTLGIETGKSKGKVGSTNNTDTEALLKTQLTEGEIEIQALNMGSGKRLLEAHKVDVNGFVAMATNAPFNDIPHAVKSRFNCICCQNQNRKDNGGLISADARPKLYDLESTVIEKLRRNQMLCAMIGSLIYVGILSEIDMQVADAIYRQVM